jgi:hypothetical protein
MEKIYNNHCHDFGQNIVVPLMSDLDNAAQSLSQGGGKEV